MIRITQAGIAARPDAVDQLRAEFAATGCAMLPGFLSPPVLRVLTKQLEKGRFEVTEEVGRESGHVLGTTFKMPQAEPAVVALNFILNSPALLDLAARVADSPPLASFVGRLHRTAANSGQHIDWHGDIADFRAVGLDINLSSEDYQGGLFQIRGPDLQVRREIGSWFAGDAFLFRIMDNWQHRLTHVESGLRTVGVGWFRTQPISGGGRLQASG